ncbi:MAG: hypothetical protein WD942_00045 [Dehalococcoidia bacterium]
MACPIHIWIPLMAAAVPAARAVRTRFNVALDARRVTRRESSDNALRVMKRWAPVGTQNLPASNLPTSPEQEQPRSF